MKLNFGKETLLQLYVGYFPISAWYILWYVVDLVVCMFVASGAWPELENENDKQVSGMQTVSLSRHGH